MKRKMATVLLLLAIAGTIRAGAGGEPEVSTGGSGAVGRNANSVAATSGAQEPADLATAIGPVAGPVRPIQQSMRLQWLDGGEVAKGWAAPEGHLDSTLTGSPAVARLRASYERTVETIVPLIQLLREEIDAVLPPSKSGEWHERATHAPHVVPWNGKYDLFVTAFHGPHDAKARTGRKLEPMWT